jgi:adenylate cyclase class 2
MTGADFRIRKESRFDAAGSALAPPLCIVTCKIKNRKDGLETNTELEWNVAGTENFEAFIGMIGLEAGFTKKKEGRLWKVPVESGTVNAEITTVSGLKGVLGAFCELELLLPPDAGVEDIRAANAALRGLLARLGIPESKIEGRYYSEMLKCL